MKSVITKKALSSKLLVVLVIIVQCIFMIFWCTEKNGMFVDELYSYGLSNGYYTPFLNNTEGYLSAWHDASFFRDYLTVQEGERFAYGSVVYNQSQDVHPPLYYMILHTICSLFPNTFTKWFGLGINLVFFVLTEIVLYLMGMLLFGENRKRAIVPLLLYGFSIAAVNTVIFIRMYMMLTFWCSLFLYLHLRLVKYIHTNEDNVKQRNLLVGLIFAVTVMGMLTQYYFLIFAFFCCAGFGLYLLFQRKWFSFVKYGIVMMGGLFLSYVIFPTMRFHIFSSYRGTEAVANLKEGSTLDRLKAFFGFLNHQVFAGWLLPLLVLAVIMIVIGRIKKNRGEERMTWIMVSIIFLTLAGDFAVIAKIAAFLQCRYIMSIYPLAAILAVFLLDRALDTFVHSVNFRVLVISVLGILLAVRGNLVYIPEFLYPDFDKVLETVHSYGDTNCIFVSSGDYKVMAETDLFMNMDQVYIYDGDEVSGVPEVASDHLNANGQIFMFVDCVYDSNQVVDAIQNMEAVESVEYLYTDVWDIWGYGNLYLIQF